MWIYFRYKYFVLTKWGISVNLPYPQDIFTVIYIVCSCWYLWKSLKWTLVEEIFTLSKETNWEEWSISTKKHLFLEIFIGAWGFDYHCCPIQNKQV